MQPSGFRYVPKQEREQASSSSEAKKQQNANKANSYAQKLMKSEVERFGFADLSLDYEKLLQDNCIYLPNYFCTTNDLTIFNKLMAELNFDSDLTNWSKHKKHENPTFSPT